VNRYKKSLRAAVGFSAAPYGYTLATWTTGAVLTHPRGIPGALDVLLFMVGVVSRVSPSRGCSPLEA
jgi:hypothetical protein